MPEYLSPGVYVEEVATGPRPIEGVSTSTAGFVGQTERGPVLPRLVTSFSEYQRWYGGLLDPAVTFLPFAAQGFFDNGGKRLFVARVTRPDAVAASLDLDTSDAAQKLQLKAVGPGAWGSRVFVKVEPGKRSGFRLVLLYYRTTPPLPLVDPTNPANLKNANRREPDVLEDYDNLGFDPQGPNYVVTRLNGSSQLVQAGPAGLSARPNNAGFTQMARGADGATAISAPDYLGSSAVPIDQRKGLAGLEGIDEISLLCVPDEVHPALTAANQTAIRSATVNQCERLHDRFAILQVEAGQGDVGTIKPADDTSYAAIYYPWIRVFEPRTQDTLLIPPGGHVTGIYARTDVERGVHKAPANEVVRGIVARDLGGNRGPLEYRLSKGEHDVLNPRGVNVIRDFRADRRGIRVWGARTLSSDPLWKYVNVRRLFLFVEESIEEGTQWVVFEPNDPTTWANVKRSIDNFLIRVWRDGALLGTTQDEAFFVKCDRTTMTQDDIDNGRLICLIGIAPVKPAEFVIFRISQKTAEAQA
jgi:phage tail sheath protein FI